jgi:hypothetical protein
MDRTDLLGRDATDPEVRAEIRRSIREIPFRDLVAEIEGEEAAAVMDQTSVPTSPVTVVNSSFMTAWGSDKTLPTPPSKRGH